MPTAVDPTYWPVSEPATVEKGGDGTLAFAPVVGVGAGSTWDRINFCRFVATVRTCSVLPYDEIT